MKHTLFSCSHLLAICLLAPAPAQSANSFIEYSKMADSDTLHNLHALGFYTIFNHARSHQYYAGLELALFEPAIAIENELVTRLVMGLSGTGTVAPYAEIGIGLLDLLFRGNESAQACNEERDCEPDMHFRAGLRLNATNHLSIGIFYEGVSFGDFQDRLSGSHSYTGVNIGVRY